MPNADPKTSHANTDANTDTDTDTNTNTAPPPRLPCLGVDVSKDALDVAGLRADETPDPDAPAGRHDNTPKGRARLLKALPPAGQCLVTLEATGGYHADLVAELLEAGHLVAPVIHEKGPTPGRSATSPRRPACSPRPTRWTRP